MKWLFALFFPGLLFSSTEEKKEFSRAYGYYLEKGLEATGLDLDPAEVISGMQQALQNKKAPMPELDYAQKLSCIRDTLAQKREFANIQEAKKFLQQNSLQSGICDLEKEKLQYIIERPGLGLPLKDYHHPLVSFRVSFLGEEPARDFEEHVLSFEQLLPAIQKGILGMTEGEKRTLYIHPDLTKDQTANNSCKLMILEVELLEVAPEKFALPSTHEIAELRGTLR